jgi:hypothetical protein
MSDNPVKPSRSLVEAVSVLKACHPLAERLVIKGIIIELSPQDQAHLLNFEQLVLAEYSDSEWSYLRVASGVKVSGVAALNSCLMRYQTLHKKPAGTES